MPSNLACSKRNFLIRKQIAADRHPRGSTFATIYWHDLFCRTIGKMHIIGLSRDFVGFEAIAGSIVFTI